MKKPTHKMDKYLIASLQPYEISYVIKRMAKEGIDTNKVEIKNAIKQVGRSRKAVYKFIRSCHLIWD